MRAETTARPVPQFSYLTAVLATLGIIILLGLCMIVFIFRIDSGGRFHITATTADVDADGDLDVVMQRTRYESEYTAFGGPAMWLNQGDGTFINTEPGIDIGGWDSVPGDVDGDGDTDLVLFTGSYLHLALNQGGAQGGAPGRFQAHNTVHPPDELGQFGSLVLGDLNGDGLLDGIAAGRSVFVIDDQSGERPNTRSFVWVNDWTARDGMIPHAENVPILEGLPVQALALGDVDGDGDLDAVLALRVSEDGPERNPGGLVLVNDGSGAFHASEPLRITSSTAVALGDLDSDGDLDALLRVQGGAEVWINQGAAQGGTPGHFVVREQEITSSGRDDHTTNVLLADVDLDGDPDALIVGSRQARIWRNDGTGLFAATGKDFRYEKSFGVAVGDLNGDGRPDVFTGDHASIYRVWFNAGVSEFR